MGAHLRYINYLFHIVARGGSRGGGTLILYENLEFLVGSDRGPAGADAHAAGGSGGAVSPPRKFCILKALGASQM